MGDMADRARELEWLRDMPVAGAEAYADARDRPYRIRHEVELVGVPRHPTGTKKWIVHTVRYGSKAEAEAMAIGLGFTSWQVFKVVATSQPKIWVTRDRTRIPVTEMEGDHLLNTLNMLYRRFQGTVIHQFQQHPSPIARRTLRDGPAVMFPDRDELAGWPALIAELRRRKPEWIPKEWKTR